MSRNGLQAYGTPSRATRTLHFANAKSTLLRVKTTATQVWMRFTDRQPCQGNVA